MTEQIIIHIVRPAVGIEYRPESPEAECNDEFATCLVGLDALAQHVGGLAQVLNLPCPVEVDNLIRAEVWRHGM